MSAHKSLDQVSDWAVETVASVDARLEGAKASQAQARLTVSLMALVSVMMLIASYNAYLSYDYGWILEDVGYQRDLASKNAPSILMEQGLKDWASSRTVQISLLGIRVSVDDAPILGSAILSILSVWLFLVVRRENHTIGFLLRDTDSPQPRSLDMAHAKASALGADQRWLIFHSVLAGSIFTACDPSLARVTSLDGPIATRPINPVLTILSNAGFRFARSFFFLFPAAACLVTFIIDRRSYFIHDPFKPEFAIPGIDAFFWKSMLVFLLCWSPLVLCCWRSNLYSIATEHVLREYGEKLGSDLLRGGADAHQS